MLMRSRRGWDSSLLHSMPHNQHLPGGGQIPYCATSGHSTASSSVLLGNTRCVARCFTSAPRRSKYCYLSEPPSSGTLSTPRLNYAGYPLTMAIPTALIRSLEPLIRGPRSLRRSVVERPAPRLVGLEFVTIPSLRPGERHVPRCSVAPAASGLLTFDDGSKP